MNLPPWHPHVDVWLLFSTIAAMYLIAIRRRTRETGADAATRRQKTLFLAGVAALWIGADWPIHDLAERYLYSVHMFQHLLFSLVAAPLLICGMPAWMWRAILRPVPIGALWRFLTRPLVAIIVFNGVLLAIHWPAVVETSVRSEPFHFLLHVVLVGSALVMWWPIMSPLPELPPLAAPAQMIYLFFQSLAPTIPASFLTFGRSPLYPIYGTFPRIWGISVMTDQLIAGLLMKLGGGLVLWAVIAWIFFRWYGQEQRDGWDPLQWNEFERRIRSEADSMNR
jgi:putative membrane protein